MQVTADSFGLPAAHSHTFKASALGAAIDAVVGTRLFADIPTAVSQMTRVGDVFEPDRQARAVYDALYRQVYLHMYPQLRPLYHAIRALDPPG